MGILEVYKYDIVVLLVVLGVIVSSVYLLKRYDKDSKAKAILLKLCVEADEYFDTGEGAERKELVLNWFFVRYKFLGLITSKTTVSALIDNIVRDYINRNKVLGI